MNCPKTDFRYLAGRPIPPEMFMSARIIVFVVAVLLTISPSGRRADAAELSAAADVILAQEGSTGGTLGNDEKSVSGGQAAAPRKMPAKVSEPSQAISARPVPPAQHPRLAVRPPAPASGAKTPRPQIKEAGASLAIFDGTWTGASTGSCIPRWSWSFGVTHGIMTGESGSNISGRIRSDGDTAGKMTVFGATYDFFGQMSATRVAGTWIKVGENGCTGTWSATK